MKNQHILLFALLALTSLSVFGVPISDGGLNTLTIKANDDPGACLLTLSMQLFAQRIEFTETVTDNTVPDCTYHNLTFWPLYKNDWSVSGQVTLSNTSDPAVFKGNLTLTTVAQQDGKACTTIGSGYWYCQFKYGSVIFTVSWWQFPNGTIDTNWKDLFYPMYGVTNMSVIYGKNVVVPSTTLLGVAGFLYTQCGGWSNNIANLNSPIIITGKVYASNVIDLKPYLSTFMVDTVLIKKTNAAVGDYLRVPTWGFYPFSGVGSGGCYTTNMTYAQILPNMSYCANGCEISFDMIDLASKKFYLLQTNGITTQANLRG